MTTDKTDYPTVGGYPSSGRSVADLRPPPTGSAPGADRHRQKQGVFVRLEPEQDEEVRALAASRGVTIGVLVREVVERWLRAMNNTRSAE